MITIFRKNQRILMLIVAILTIIAFAFLYDYNSGAGAVGPNAVAEAYGRSLTQADIDRQVKNYSLALALQQYALIGELGGMNSDENQAVSEFIFNLMVLQHEASKLGVSPTDTQIADRIKGLSVFLTGGQFDPRKYAKFVQDQLGPRGFTELQLNSVMRDALSLERVKDIVASPASVSAAELDEASRILQKVDIGVLQFPVADAAAVVTVSDEEIESFTQRNRNNLVTAESREIDFVKFPPLAGSETATGRAKIEAQQKQADAAMSFVDGVTSEGFEKAAASAGLEIGNSPEFDRRGMTEGGKALAEELKELVAPSFLLTDAAPVSDVLQSGDSFYVVKLGKVHPQRPLTAEEIRPIAEGQIRAQKAAQANRVKAESDLAAIRAAMASGQSFDAAATATGRQVEVLTGLDASSPDLPADQQDYARATQLLEPGGLSGFLPSAQGGFAVYLQTREPLDEAAQARRVAEVKPGILAGKRQLLFGSWLAKARENADISVGSPRR